MNINNNENFMLALEIDNEAKPFEMIWVDPGSFDMGTNNTDEYLKDESFKVTFSRGCWLGRYLVTQSHWNKVMGKTELPQERNFPVINISWNEAQQFCDQLNSQYANNLPKDYKFRLPTEAQWEFALRANTTTGNDTGCSSEELLRVAWCKENSEGRLHEVGLKEPNRWGFYDMLGNVREWCFDMYVNYPNEPQIDWIGIDNERLRVVRSSVYLASYKSISNNSAYRIYARPDLKKEWLGFRVALSPV